MSSGVETEARRGRTHGRDEADDDHDTVPEHLLCVNCQSECGWKGPKAKQDAHEKTCVYRKADAPCTLQV